MRRSKPVPISQVFKEFDRGIREFPRRDLKDLFREPAKGSWKDRFSIYATGFSARSRDALEDCFELLPKIAGQKKWLILGGKFTTEIPSKFYNLSDLGYPLPHYLKRKKYPASWVAVANFELEIWKSFHARVPAAPLSAVDCAQISERTKFRWSPAAQLVSSKWNLSEAWLARAGKPKLKRKKEWSVIYRTGGTVSTCSMDVDEFKVLKALRGGKTFGAALDPISKTLKPETLQKWMRNWVEGEIFLKPKSKQTD